MQTLPPLRFPNGNTAHVVHASPYADALEVVSKLGIAEPMPALFLSGGASAMEDKAMAQTYAIVEQGIARFAAEHNIVVVDGGTDVGIMQMMGRARHKLGNRFPLVGCAPADKVLYPGMKPTGDQTRTTLEPNHSHMILVDDDHWGAESDMIVGAVRAFTRGVLPGCGILINGGKIAQYDVYIASARGERAIPVIVVDGSGRSADTIARASKTKAFDTAMIKAIVQGGKVEVISLKDGADAMYNQLKGHFNVAPAQ